MEKFINSDAISVITLTALVFGLVALLPELKMPVDTIRFGIE